MIYFGYRAGTLTCSRNPMAFTRIVGSAEDASFKLLPYWEYQGQFWYPNLVPDSLNSELSVFQQPQAVYKTAPPLPYHSPYGEVRFYRGKDVG